ncbi:MAG TPA: penicillin acylase family protein [Terriglobales bacterium]|nr:penicillin acylase family protein [Terriglobales bacterium]
MTAEMLLQTSSSSTKSRLRSTIPLLAIIAIAIMGMAAILLSSYAHSPLPPLDGNISVVGLSAPVSVTRDRQGVPTIEATTLRDLFFAQGYVTAQDRLFQMDFLRRAAAGELSEVVGEVALHHDRQQRILGIRAAAEKGFSALSTEDRQQFDAYARGVNAFIESHKGKLPLEFRALHYSPKPWSAQDSVLIAYQMVETLSTSPQAPLTREKILAKLGPELTADLYVNNSWRDHPPTQPPAALDQVPSDAKRSPSAVTFLSHPWRESPNRSWNDLPQLAPLFRDELFPIGSNNWVLSGSHTVSGKPLLSNDMHLGHQMPNLWYEVHLHSAGFDVAGVSLPGHPFVIVGHNRRIAWAFTNVGPTVQDAYIETFNDTHQYLTPEGWKDPEIRHEIIHVKGKPDASIDVQITRHGPIVTELYRGDSRQIALQWTLYDGPRDPFFRLDAAENWQEFRQALAEFDAPSQNAVFADIDGNIGYQTTGKIPIRATGDGSLPVNGNDNTHEWTGYIPFEKLPSVYNPPSGIIATANGRISPEKYPYSISTEWESPWRTDRIYHVLQSGKKFSAADMLSLETDVYSELDRYVADRIVYAIDHAQKPSPLARQAADILREWNGQMDENMVAPTIATHARDELRRLLLQAKLGSSDDPGGLSWKSYHWMMETVWLENVLSHQPPRWLPSQYANYDELITAALEQSLKKAPKRLDSWKWGAQNTVTIENPILSKVPLIGSWTGPGENPQSGNVYTVKAVGSAHGPSERFTADLSNLDASTLNLVTGQSGNFLSPYYMDQWPAWYKGTTFVLPFSKTAVENSATHRLMLEPR